MGEVLDRNMFVSSCAYVFCAESQTVSILTKISQGEIRCFLNSEMLRKPDGSKFRYVSADGYDGKRVR